MMPYELKNDGVSTFNPRQRARGVGIAKKKKKIVMASRDRDKRREVREQTRLTEEGRLQSLRSDPEGLGAKSTLRGPLVDPGLVEASGDGSFEITL